MSPGHLCREVFGPVQSRGGPEEHPGHPGEIIFQLAWEHLGIPSEGLEEVAGKS